MRTIQRHSSHIIDAVVDAIGVFKDVDGDEKKEEKR